MTTITDLEKRFGAFRLSIPDLCFEDGVMHGLIGPNGCGKTTLARITAGTLRPDSGLVDYGGLTVRDITMVGAKPYLTHDTVYGNLVYPLRLRGIKPDAATVARWLELCGLTGQERQYARALSAGQQQKLALARALIFEPRLIIFDESLANLDPDSVEQFEHAIAECHERSGSICIVISHQLSSVYRLCSRVHYMENGSILASGTAQEIILEPQLPEIRRFIRKETLPREDAE